MILTVDPGKMTGWCLTWGVGTWGAWQAPMDEFVDWAGVFLRERRGVGEHVHIVSERFVITGGTLRKARNDVNWSIEQIGVLRYLGRRFGHHFELQSASDAMSLAPDDRLRALRWWSPGRDHANDAARHMLLAVSKHDREYFDVLARRFLPMS